jgi:tetratricopeptide (TPR) repeat protein
MPLSVPDQEFEALLQQGMAACKAIDQARAQQLLAAAIQRNPRSEQAWLWLSGVLTDPEHRRACLEKVLAINPENAHARSGLQWLDEHHPRPQPMAPPEPEPLLEELPSASISSAPVSERPSAFKCPWCDAEVAGLDERCPTCDHDLEFSCPGCGQPLTLDITRCPDCDYVMGDFGQPQKYLDQLGRAYLAKGLLTEALPVSFYWVEIDQKNPKAHLRLSQVYAKLDHAEESMAEAERVLELDPRNVEALYHVARWYLNHSQPDKLATLLDGIHKRLAKTPKLAMVAGDLEYERGQYPAAFRAYKQALTSGQLDAPSLARLHYRMGRMYLIAEDIKAALTSFHACLATRADTTEVQDAQKQIDWIRPPLPAHALSGYSETARAMAGPVLLVWFTGLIGIGFHVSYINILWVLGFLAVLPGSYLLAGALSTPLAREWRELLGQEGLKQPLAKTAALLGGGFLVVLAFGFVLVR